MYHYIISLNTNLMFYFKRLIATRVPSYILRVSWAF